VTDDGIESLEPGVELARSLNLAQREDVLKEAHSFTPPLRRLPQRCKMVYRALFATSVQQNPATSRATIATR
jgi:hypothetical protein